MAKHSAIIPDGSCFEATCENPDFLSKQLITCIGNKRKLKCLIERGLQKAQKCLGKSHMDIFDGFSGSGFVSRLAKQYASTLYVNDLELYSFISNKCYLSNTTDVNMNKIIRTIKRLNNQCELVQAEGIIEEGYAPKNDDDIKEGERVFFSNSNAKRIDNYRRLIKKIPLKDRHFYLALLLQQASVHNNTSGVFKGFYKNTQTGRGQFGGNGKNCLQRILGKIELPIPIFSNFNCDVHVSQEDVNQVVKKIECDVAYYDPPYNQHPYGSNYFMLNLITAYKKPKQISKVSGIPTDWNKSVYNKHKEALEAFEDLISHTKAKIILISYNDEGIIGTKQMKYMLKKYGIVKTIQQDYNVFRGSRNLRDRTQKVKEILYVVETF